MPKCVSYFPFSCGTLQKSKNWFDVLNFGFSHIHGYSGSTVIQDSRVNRCNLHLGKKEPSQKCNNVLVRLPVVKLVAKVVG